jgi:hypothetical protein
MLPVFTVAVGVIVAVWLVALVASFLVEDE